MKMVVQALQGPLVTEDQQELWECQDPRASMVTQGRQENKDLLECQAREVLLEKMEKLAQLDLQAHLVLQETEENRDLQVSMDSRVYLEIKALLENMENQATLVFPESSVLWVQLDQGENEGYQEREENWGHLVCRGLKGYLVHLVLMVLREVLVLLVLLVMLVLQGFRECQERGVSLDLLGLKVTEEQLVRKDQRAQLEMTVQEELPVLSAHLDLLDPVERRENLDLKDHLDHQDPEEYRVQEVTLVPLVLLDLLDLLVLMDNLESRESLESQARKEMLDHQDLKAWLVLMGLLGQQVLLG